MTYSIIARDESTGEMGVAAQSQAFAVGSSVPWALPGYGVIATQSMGEPMYGELGLDALRAGLTAPEALRALRSVDPHPERRQVAMVDGRGGIDVYTGESSVAEAGHRVGTSCAALANMVVAPAVWEGMVTAFESATGSLAARLLAALHAAEDAGGDFRGRRSAAILVVRAERTGRPWRDQLVDLRVDDHHDPLGELDRLVRHSSRYHQTVEAFELALDGDGAGAVDRLDGAGIGPDDDPDLQVWHAVVLALGGREREASERLRALAASAPEFVEALRRFGRSGLVGDRDLLEAVLPPGGGPAGDGGGAGGARP